MGVTFWTAVPVLAGIAIQNLLPRSWREILVFWKVKARLPGHRAFSFYAKKDARVASSLPIFSEAELLSPEQQNARWFRWYNKYSSRPAVAEASRLYLAFRDLAAASLLTSPAAIIVLANSSANHVTNFLLVLSFSLCSYFVSIIVARNKASDLVTNVLALRSAESEEA